MEETIKKHLIKKVFEKAKTESFKKTKNSLSDYLSVCFEEKYGHRISERTLVRYYDFLVLEKKPNHFIDDYNLDILSAYLGYKNYVEFSEFWNKISPKKELPQEEKTKQRFKLKHYVSLFVIALVGMVIWQFVPLFKKKEPLVFEKKQENTSVKTTMNHKVQLVGSSSIGKNLLSENIAKQVSVTQTERKKECMYWNGNHYEEVFCDEWIDGKTIIAINQELKLLRKIDFPDTLTVENALGKVWYVKSNNKVEFFTHYGIHPENGKTLKPITRYIIKKYIQK